MGLHLISSRFQEALALSCLLPTEHHRTAELEAPWLGGLRGIANPLTGPFSEPTIVLLAKHHHMFLVPFPFLGLLALTGIGFSWCLLWLLAISCSYA